MKLKEYDVIVVGGGHAGCEAAAASANMGSDTLLITMDMTKFAQMSCNPAMGGIAKGQIVREIDALGGLSAIVTDKSTIQFRMLNLSKGPAMWSPRAQCDRMKFTEYWREELEKIEKLDLFQDSVTQLILEGDRIRGVKTKVGFDFLSKTVILTIGTFEKGLMHVGNTQIQGGRYSESASYGISDQLREHGFEVDRMKTGTPARIDGRSIDFSKLVEQKGDDSKERFSFIEVNNFNLVRRSCYIARTNKEVHGILEKGFKDSPLFGGIIQGRGPRYCPSIEDKIVTFADKEQHQLFIEPEGEHTNEYYINGFSSSLPWQVQYEALRKIEGLENVIIYRPGYAIEYDYYPPTQLYANLETKIVENLFFAGQINGTTGYEEAAAQGIMAGINAVLRIKGKSPFVLKRDEAYIGVLIDDLITKGVDEPYRMFTSRAEYRILLRQDNADSRLTPLGIELGLADDSRLKRLKEKEKAIEEMIFALKKLGIEPVNVNDQLKEIGSTPLKQKVKAHDLLLRPEIRIDFLIEIDESVRELFAKIDDSLIEEVKASTEILVKYSGYIDREKLNADKIKRLENIKLKKDTDYQKLKSLSTEARQKLSRIQPETIAQASRISGVSPADISVLLVHLGR